MWKQVVPAEELKPCPWCKEIPTFGSNHWATIKHKPDCWRTLVTEDRVEHFHERVFAAWNSRSEVVDTQAESEQDAGNEEKNLGYES